MTDSGQIGTRFWSADTKTFIDVLAPDNSSQRRDLTTVLRRRALEAKGTDYALDTAVAMAVRYTSDRPVLRVRVPTLAGAVYAKATAYRRISSFDNPEKHLKDAAQLLVVARRDDFRPRANSAARRRTRSGKRTT